MVQVRKNISRCGRTLWRELQLAAPRQAQGARCLSEGSLSPLSLSPSFPASLSLLLLLLLLLLSLALYLSLSLSLSLFSLSLSLSPRSKYGFEETNREANRFSWVT